MTKSRTYSVISRGGRPLFAEDGQPALLANYCSCGPGWWDAWLAAHRRFVESGRRLFWLMPTGGYNGEWGTSPFWTAPGRIHDPPLPMPATYRGLDAQAQALLEMAPDARFFVRMMDMPPAAWHAANPDDTVVTDDGPLELPSMASETYLAELRAFLTALTRTCEAASWGNRVIGYVIYPQHEGGTLPKGLLFDRCPAMQRAFRRHLASKYGTDDALRAAWGMPDAALASARVPGEDEFRRRTPGPVPMWPDARLVQPERDYFELQEHLFPRYLKTMLEAFRAAAAPGKLCGIDALKGNMVGWMTHPVFTAHFWREHYGDFMLAAGTGDMAGMLDWPEFDLLATPHDYRCRWAGFGYDPEGIGDSAWLHGKVMLVEEDQRTYANNERGLFGSIEPGEEEAVFLRNEAASLSKGQQNYPMDVCVGYFESETVQRALARCAGLAERFLNVPRAEVPCVTMLVDPRAGRYTDFSSEYNDLAVIRQRIWGLNHCGAPTRTFLWDDLERADFPACHKLFLLPNGYLADARNERLLREKLFRDGHVIVFGPGSGITDGTTVSPDGAARWMGMDFDLFDYEYPRFVTIDAWAHPVTAGCGSCDSFGDTFRYGPVLVPRERAAAACAGGVKPRAAQAGGDGSFVRLGSIALDNGKRRPGLAVKEFGRGAAGNGAPGPRGAGDYAVVFTAAVPLPAWLLRNLARFSGTPVYDDQDDVVYADSRMVAVHAVRPGARTIRLPGARRVTDVVSGRDMGRTDRIRFAVRAPVTRWFALAE